MVLMEALMARRLGQQWRKFGTFREGRGCLGNLEQYKLMSLWITEKEDFVMYQLDPAQCKITCLLRGSRLGE
jgi:hypothetical protein